jgi:formylglycine-generating enzyme required for sulfatase activity
MPALSRLLPALIAGVLFTLFADGASATKPQLPPALPRIVEQDQIPPGTPPRQLFPEKAVQPLTPELEQALHPRDSFKQCTSCPEMVVVPKGSSMMGTPADEPDRFKGEDPIHRVTFAKPFAVGRFTISFDEWDAYLVDGGSHSFRVVRTLNMQP